jgi:hypothetical protein
MGSRVSQQDAAANAQDILVERSPISEFLFATSGLAGLLVALQQLVFDCLLSN